MGARSEVAVVEAPFPVVFDAFVKSLPERGFTVTSADPDRGRITLARPNHRFTLAVGAVDAITTEWVATVERRVALRRGRTTAQFAAIGTALDDYLRAYYPR